MFTCLKSDETEAFQPISFQKSPINFLKLLVNEISTVNYLNLIIITQQKDHETWMLKEFEKINLKEQKQNDLTK